MKKALSRTQKEKGLKAEELRRIHLNGREVTYTLMRCRRRTIGMRIDRSGLTVRVPVRETIQWVESVLQNRADWIVAKLNEWKNRKPSGPAWEEGSIFPLLGEPWRVTVTPAGMVHMIPLQTGAGEPVVCGDGYINRAADEECEVGVEPACPDRQICNACQCV